MRVDSCKRSVVSIDEAFDVIAGRTCAIGGTITSERRRERRTRVG